MSVLLFHAIIIFMLFCMAFSLFCKEFFLYFMNDAVESMVEYSSPGRPVLVCMFHGLAHAWL